MERTKQTEWTCVNILQVKFDHRPNTHGLHDTATYFNTRRRVTLYSVRTNMITLQSFLWFCRTCSTSRSTTCWRRESTTTSTGCTFSRHCASCMSVRGGEVNLADPPRLLFIRPISRSLLILAPRSPPPTSRLSPPTHTHMHNPPLPATATAALQPLTRCQPKDRD